MKNMLMINGSPRKNGTDAAILGMVAEKAKKYDYKTEIVNICDLHINGCKACMYCKKNGKCAQNDDMTPIYDKIRDATAIIIASPVYFAAETGQMKCFMDRLYAMISNKDGKRTVDIGKVSKASIVITCGSPDGYMTYGNILTRLTMTLKSLGITDVSGTIISAVDPDKAEGSDFVREYLDGLDFQLGM